MKPSLPIVFVVYAANQLLPWTMRWRLFAKSCVKTPLDPCGNRNVALFWSGGVKLLIDLGNRNSYTAHNRGLCCVVHWFPLPTVGYSYPPDHHVCFGASVKETCIPRMANYPVQILFQMHFSITKPKVTSNFTRLNRDGHRIHMPGAWKGGFWMLKTLLVADVCLALVYDWG